MPARTEDPSIELDRLVRCHANIIEGRLAVVRALPAHRVEEEEGVVRCAAPAAVPGFNAVFVTQAPSDVAGVLRRSREFMERVGVHQWIVLAWPEAAGSLAPAAVEAGLVGGRRVPGLVRTAPTGPIPPPPKGLEVRPVLDPDAWVEFIATGAQGFGGPRPARPLEGLPFALSRSFRAFLGVWDGEPVATSVAFPWNGVVGIFFVSTRPEFRGRGIGTALTWRAAAVGPEAGCSDVFLQATEMGDPVYRAMGFREVTSYVEWETAPPGRPSPGR